MPRDLWDRAQARVAAQRAAVSPTVVGPKFRRYLLSGFVRCATCGGNYIITTRHSYRCGTFRNRGETACANHQAISRRRLERAVLDGLRDHLYTEENLRGVVDRVREILRERARHYTDQHRHYEYERELRKVEREIEHVKQAVRLGKATSTLLGMLEEAGRRREALLSSVACDDGVPERLGRVLERLPELVRAHLSDLETLLAAQQIDQGKAILAALDTTVTLHPYGDYLEAEITGQPERVLLPAASAGARQGQLSGVLVAGGGGFEPPLTGPEPVVLPLDDPPENAKAVSLYNLYRAYVTMMAPPHPGVPARRIGRERMSESPQRTNANQEGTLPCPRCRGEMHPMFLYEDRDPDVWLCFSCGHLEWTNPQIGRRVIPSVDQ